ncbi:hypothetical protein LTR37_000764 [Vermiconidia calcicola]|uniref:Uncharacterized protein n=1 Tax=Vermiconidia calcicola TaxID=1690605 RepID=A0ACC3NXC9_9PEZI|nr:hypothetical protein LTR37_000764 [Vermiconidia calcicola]
MARKRKPDTEVREPERKSARQSTSNKYASSNRTQRSSPEPEQARTSPTKTRPQGEELASDSAQEGKAATLQPSTERKRGISQVEESMSPSQHSKSNSDTASSQRDVATPLGLPDPDNNINPAAEHVRSGEESKDGEKKLTDVEEEDSDSDELPADPLAPPRPMQPNAAHQPSVRDGHATTATSDEGASEDPLSQAEQHQPTSSGIDQELGGGDVAKKDVSRPQPVDVPTSGIGSVLERGEENAAETSRPQQTSVSASENAIVWSEIEMNVEELDRPQHLDTAGKRVGTSDDKGEVEETTDTSNLGPPQAQHSTTPNSVVVSVPDPISHLHPEQPMQPWSPTNIREALARANDRNRSVDSLEDFPVELLKLIFLPILPEQLTKVGKDGQIVSLVPGIMCVSPYLRDVCKHEYFKPGLAGQWDISRKEGGAPQILKEHIRSSGRLSNAAGAESSATRAAHPDDNDPVLKVKIRFVNWKLPTLHAIADFVWCFADPELAGGNAIKTKYEITEHDVENNPARRELIRLLPVLEEEGRRLFKAGVDNFEDVREATWDLMARIYREPFGHPSYYAVGWIRVFNPVVWGCDAYEDAVKNDPKEKKKAVKKVQGRR